ncbi:MAG: sulfate reduction electron transfer complex DsrMKJOP subunit DsrO [Thiohalomonadales bacterium]
MDSTKRQFFKTATVLVAGAVSNKAYSGINKQPPRREGDSSKRWAMVIDLQRCIGCQACTVSCHIENQAPIGQFRTTVSEYEVTDALSGKVSHFTLPRLCNHCENPPCVPVCPVSATYQRKDGIVVVDSDRCVGCAYCVQACPYDARFINPITGTADKCTFCTHRLDANLLPACVESCVGGARNIGDLNNPDSEINKLLNDNKGDIKVLKPEMNTDPHVYYIGMSAVFQSGVDGAEPSVIDLLSSLGEEL